MIPFPIFFEVHKEYFNYSDLCDSLKTIKLNNNIIVNYNNLNKYINTIISKNNILNVLNLGKNELYENIIDYKNIEAQIENKNNIIYYSNFYIINSEIMDIIESIFFDEEINIKMKQIFVDLMRLNFIKNLKIKFSKNLIIIISIYLI